MSQQQNNSRLGKGLSAIIGGDLPSVDELRKPVGYVNKEIAGARPNQNTSDVLRIPIELIQPNPFQPRQTFDQEKLEELCASIKNLGLISPITVRKVEDHKYQIISGERRYKACRMAGLTEVPAYIIPANDQAMHEMAIVENIQRENLDPIEIALGYQRLMDECHLTQEAVSDRLGKNRASVANQLRLLKLPLKIQHDLKVRLITVGHAKALLGLEDPTAQEVLCDVTIKQGLNVRQLEEKVRQVLEELEPGKEPKKPKKLVYLPTNCVKLQETLTRDFAGKVKISRDETGCSTISIKFNSDSQIDNLLNVLTKK